MTKAPLGDRPILVTGSHRSGSTWVGRMIAASPSVTYIHEPFNIFLRPRMTRARFRWWFTYVCDENAAAFETDLADTLKLKYPTLQELGSARSPRQVAKVLWHTGRLAAASVLRRRALMKDPIAIFSTEWLAARLRVQPVIMIRHPAAFAGSLKRANWTHSFSHFLEQPLLMQDHLSDFRAEIEAFARKDRDVLDQAILLWNLIHHVILKYRRAHPEWIFVRHEDLSSDPVAGFQRIFHQLGLAFSPATRKKIEAYSDRRNARPSDAMYELRRDSRSTIASWTKRLGAEEIRRVRAGTAALSQQLYGEGEWSLASV